MTELWHRQSTDERNLIAGEPWRFPTTDGHEVLAGRIVEEATFEYSDPNAAIRASPSAPRIDIQVRTGVRLLYHGPGFQGPHSRFPFENQIAIGSIRTR
jgi:hypothetical protein